MTDAVWPMVLVLVTGIYGYWAVQRELVSSRPEVSKSDMRPPVPTPGVKTVHARVWEDPLGAVEADASDTQPTTLRLIHDWTLHNYEAPPDPRRTIPGFPEIGEKEKQQVAQRKNATQTFFAELAQKPTLCLPVLLPGGPFAEDKEKRMRIRYAVATALSASGYHLPYSKRMSYFRSRVFVRVLLGWQENDVVVPVKLYKPANESHKQILVFWINESSIGKRPLLTLHRILQQVFGSVTEVHRDNVEIRVIGPSNSDTLELINDELKCLAKQRCFMDEVQEWQEGNPTLDAFARASDGGYEEFLHWYVESYSPLKYTDPWITRGLADTSEAACIYSARATETLELEKYGPFKIKRVIGTDDELVKLIGNELKLRGAAEKVVLISEHDTTYGRSIVKDFQEELGKDRVLGFHVLRGIDGMLPGDRTQETIRGRPQGNAQQNLWQDIIERPPEGRSQYDYLRRLRHWIEQSAYAGTNHADDEDEDDDGEANNEDGHERDDDDDHEKDDHKDDDHKDDDHGHGHDKVTAIGVVGSDVYDKLLVLRALKPYFPDVAFFTTDLDAIYTHHIGDRHTQNLIIATHFGLTLHRDLQTTTAPFRDSYQTSTFLATRLAVDVEERESLHALLFSEQGKRSVPAMTYVVGRDTIHRLSSDGMRQSEDHAVQPDHREASASWHYLAVLLVGTALVVWSLGWLNWGKITTAPVWQQGEFRQVRYFARAGMIAYAGLTIFFLISGKWGADASTFFAGCSTWPRNLLFTAGGASSVVAFTWLVNGFATERDDLEDSSSQTDVQTAIRNIAVEKHVIKIGIVSLTLMFCGVALIVEADSALMWSIGTGVLIFMLLVWPAQQRTHPNIVLDDSPRTLVGRAAIIVIVVGLIAWGGHELFETGHAGWHPYSLSRGPAARWGDALAILFGFSLLVLLFCQLVYLQVYIREWSLNTKQSPPSPTAGDADKIEYWLSVHERLRAVAYLSHRVATLAPALMAIFLLLLIANHPRLSPNPLPMGLLFVSTMLVIIYVGASLLLRWHFRRERREELEGLEYELVNEQRLRNADSPLSKELKLTQTQIEGLNTGVFSDWSRAPLGWILGGGTAVALLDLWIRWFMLGL